MIRFLKSLNQLSDCISSKLSKHCSTQQGAKYSGRYFCLKKEKKIKKHTPNVWLSQKKENEGPLGTWVCHSQG